MHGLSDRRFLAIITIIYITLIIIIVLTINPYFARMWDVVTFIDAAESFRDGGSFFDLYARSRANRYWPYAYPPLHALVTLPFLFIHDIFTGIPDHLLARFPTIIFDIATAWLIYRILRKHSTKTAQIGTLLWLFNPVTIYNIAAQGHFESEWIFFVLLAYYLHDEKRGGVYAPALSLAVAFLFKQIAVIFAIPYFLTLLITPKIQRKASCSLYLCGNSLFRVTIASVTFLAIVGAVCLPFILHSNDFAYMNLTYVSEVPVQTQSWILWLLSFKSYVTEPPLISELPLLKYQTWITMGAVVLLSVYALSRRKPLYEIGTLIALLFFLTSKKVMGYYYIMLFPFLLITLLPRGRHLLACGVIVFTSWVAHSPYYASWGNPAHLPIYAALGTINSAVFAYLFWQVWRGEHDETSHNSPCLFVVLSLTLEQFISALLQHLRALQIGANGIFWRELEKITKPLSWQEYLLVPGTELNAVVAFIIVGLLAFSLILVLWRGGRQGWGKISWQAWAIIAVFYPLFFATYYLTLESTAVFEFVMRIFGTC